MENQTIFKTAFYGFDKEAVLKYIDEMSEKATKSEDALQSKMEEVVKSREQLEVQIQSFEEKINKIEEDLNLEQGKNKKLSDMIDNLQVEIDRQRRQAEAKEREYLAQQEQSRQIKIRAESIEYKSKKYDEASATIGAAILEAQQTAKHIIDAASEKAVTISRDADVVITSILGKIDGMQTDFSALRSQVNDSISMLNNKFDEIEKEIEHSREMVMKASGNEEEVLARQAEVQEQPIKVVWEEDAVEAEEQESESKEPPFGRLNITEQELQKHRYF